MNDRMYLKRGVHSRGIPAVSVAALALLVVAGQVTAADLDISQVPLFLGGQVEPNILYILDDSGSMNLSFVPDICEEWNTKRAKSAAYNTLYYDPNITYLPPLDHNGDSLGDALFAAAWTDGYARSGSVDLSRDYRPTWSGSVNYGCTSGSGTYGKYSATNSEAAYYYLFDATNSGCNGSPTDDDCYDKVVVSATSGPGSVDERTNFANWYSYYRTRLMTAKAGSSRAFATLTSWPRVGYGKINQGSSTVDGQSTATLQRGVRTFGGAAREEFFDWLFAMGTNVYTPLRKALNDAGRYFTRTDDLGPYNTTPGASGGENLSCRQNYTIVMTDGYWNSDAASTSGARENNDGSTGARIVGPNSQTYTYEPHSPFSDSRSNTLADVAMYYWKNDLAPGDGMPNNVPTSAINPAFWQHMVTFGVGLGVPTVVDPEAAFAAILSGADITWPDPEVDNTSTRDLPLGRADDLLHAAVNGRGGFFNAQDPQTFATQLSDALTTIVQRANTSATAMTTNSVALSTESHAYQATLDSANWSGDLIAYSLEVEENLLVKTPAWSASEQLPAPDSRRILTWDGSGGIDFRWDSLTSGQKAHLDNDENLLNYLRGDQAGEGTAFRVRSTRIGDIVDSDPVFVWKEHFGYHLLPEADGGSTYGEFVSSKQSRTPVVYVGANDGMLHAFNADSGVELFAYVPNALFPHLASLAQPDYSHKFFVDGDISVGDAHIGGWKSILLGATGAGGRAVFAIDVTNPGSPSVLWELAGTDDADLGFTIGMPIVARAKSGAAADGWVALFANGYDPEDPGHTARLFVVDLETGAVIKKIDTGVGSADAPNGLSSPSFVYDDAGYVQYVYAGDLRGNLWKFDLSATNSSSWGVAFHGQPLFVARSPSGQIQPITVKPQIHRHAEGGYLVMFGTGKFFSTGDTADMTVQSFYGIWDNDSPIDTGDRSLLQNQTITHQEAFEDFEVRTVSDHDVDWSTRRGWYLDLIYGNTADGERVIYNPQIWFERIRFQTTIPSEDPCSAGMSGWLMELDYMTGRRLSYTLYDLNGDGSLDGSDQIHDTDPSGIRRNQGGPSGTVYYDGKEYLLPEGEGDGIATATSLADVTGRKSWRELNRY